MDFFEFSTIEIILCFTNLVDTCFGLFTAFKDQKTVVKNSFYAQNRNTVNRKKYKIVEYL